MTGHRQPTNPFRTFQEARDFLEKAIDYEKRTSVKYTDQNFNLARMEDLLAQMGNPHRSFRVIHVAGTKGKGSTAAVLESCLRAAGLKTGLHTSPHLVSLCERMLVNGQPPSEQEFCRLLSGVRAYVEKKRREARDTAPTYFEITTALSLLHFAQQKVDWAVIETGLGGRLDSTNVVSPECCVITAIALDHMDKLGDTVDKIAGEKAGIFKPGVPVILAAQPYAEALEVLRSRAEAVDCPRWEVGREVQVAGTEPLSAPPDSPEAPVGWRFSVRVPGRTYDGLSCSLLGGHQVQNCATAIAALEMLRGHGRLDIAPQAVREGIARCRWPARVELLGRRPIFILDAAHTRESVAALLDAVRTHFPGRRLRIVFGSSADKNWQGMLVLLAPRCVSLITTQAFTPRAADAGMLAHAAREAGMKSARAVRHPPKAVREALQEAAPDDVVCVTGSFFVAGEVLDAWRQGAIPQPQRQ